MDRHVQYLTSHKTLYINPSSVEISRLLSIYIYLSFQQVPPCLVFYFKLKSFFRHLVCVAKFVIESPFFGRWHTKSSAKYGNKIERWCNGAKVREALTKCKYVHKTFEIVLQYLLNFLSTWNVIYIDPSRKVFYNL